MCYVIIIILTDSDTSCHDNRLSLALLNVSSHTSLHDNTRNTFSSLKPLTSNSQSDYRVTRSQSESRRVQTEMKETKLTKREKEFANLGTNNFNTLLKNEHLWD